MFWRLEVQTMEHRAQLTPKPAGKLPSPLHIEEKTNNSEFHTLLLPITATAGRLRGAHVVTQPAALHLLSWHRGVSSGISF